MLIQVLGNVNIVAVIAIHVKMELLILIVLPVMVLKCFLLIKNVLAPALMVNLWIL